MPDTSNHRIVFLSKIEELVHSKQLFKATFSKPRPNNKDIINVYLKPAEIKHELQYSLTYRYKTRDEVRNFKHDEIMAELNSLIGLYFFNAVLFSKENETSLLQNKKEHSTLFSKKLKEQIVLASTHDHQKMRYIPENSFYLQALGLAGKDGKIFDKSQDKYRQINKYIEILDHLIKDIPNSQPITVADMGSGKGYLTFALYDFLTNSKGLNCKMTGYELREDLVALCYRTAIESGFVGLGFQQKSISEANVAETDIVIALHACDIATDMAIAKGIQANARYIIVSPCCHKQVRSVMHHQNALSPILKNGILEERQAEILTDGIRALLMEANGYRTQVFEFISSEHTGKNLMITGVKSTPNTNAIEEVNAIKKMFGIQYHHLEKLLQ
ncbi:MAG: SAM-dependent methyltransferase [Saprospiraceae bacterium]|nr:SAM-dependent methyltransferase [Saprospiraceae bacterium]